MDPEYRLDLVKRNHSARIVPNTRAGRIALGDQLLVNWGPFIGVLALLAGVRLITSDITVCNWVTGILIVVWVFSNILAPRFYINQVTRVHLTPQQFDELSAQLDDDNSLAAQGAMARMLLADGETL